MLKTYEGQYINHHQKTNRKSGVRRQRKKCFVLPSGMMNSRKCNFLDDEYEAVKNRKGGIEETFSLVPDTKEGWRRVAAIFACHAAAVPFKGNFTSKELERSGHEKDLFLRRRKEKSCERGGGTSLIASGVS